MSSDTLYRQLLVKVDQSDYELTEVVPLLKASPIN